MARLQTNIRLDDETESDIAELLKATPGMKKATLITLLVREAIENRRAGNSFVVAALDSNFEKMSKMLDRCLHASIAGMVATAHLDIPVRPINKGTAADYAEDILNLTQEAFMRARIRRS